MAEEEQHVPLLAGLEAVQGRLFLQGASPGGDPSWGWDSPEAIGEGESVLVELRQGPRAEERATLPSGVRRFYFDFLKAAGGVERIRSCGRLCGLRSVGFILRPQAEHGLCLSFLVCPVAFGNTAEARSAGLPGGARKKEAGFRTFLYC